MDSKRGLLNVWQIVGGQDLKNNIDFYSPMLDVNIDAEIERRTNANIFDLKREDVLETIEKNYRPVQVKEAQRQAVNELFDFCKSAAKCGVSLRVLFRISAKKALFLTSAKTVDEVEEIKRPSVPHFEERGLIVTKKYHIPEEELMLLGIASRMGKLTMQAQERFVYLYELCFGNKEVVEYE